jgi:hypothetical protein
MVGFLFKSLLEQQTNRQRQNQNRASVLNAVLHTNIGE